jgi:hypothetical protein
MAIDLTLKSTAITNREATPAVLNSPASGGASKLKSVHGYLASVTAALSITSVIRMVEVPSNANVRAVIFQSAAQTAGKFDIGVYRNNADGGAVVDADLFASAVDCASAVVKTDVTNESTNYTTALQNQPLWQAAGLSADPHSTLDICLTVVTTDVTTGTGAVALEVQYTD